MSESCASVPSGLGLLPEPEGRVKSFIASATINLSILALLLYLGMTVRRVIAQHRYEQSELVFPTTPSQPAKVKVPPPPKLPEIKIEEPRISLPKPEPAPPVKPVQMETKLPAPVIKAIKPSIVLSPQPKAALAAATPAQVPQAHPSTARVHLGDLFGVMPNPAASRPATVAAIGNPYGGMRGVVGVPHGVVGSTGIGGGTSTGSYGAVSGHVASVGIPAMRQAAPTALEPEAPARTTSLEILSKPPAQYTAEARQLRIQGDVVLRVTFTAAGRVIVQGIVHGLGHGLDEEARRVAEQIRFRPATRNGQSVDSTTNIVISFQLA